MRTATSDVSRLQPVNRYRLSVRVPLHQCTLFPSTQFDDFRRKACQFQDYSQELNMHCLEAFGLDDASCGYWCYHVPTGLGEHILMILHLNMKAGDNIMQMTFYRQPLEGVAGRLDDLKPVQIAPSLGEPIAQATGRIQHSQPCQMRAAHALGEIAASRSR